MEAVYLNYRTPKRVIIASMIIGVLPLIPTLIAAAIASVFSIPLSEAGPPNVPFGSLLYAMSLCFWGVLISGPIGIIGATIGIVWSLCVAAINKSRRLNLNA